MEKQRDPRTTYEKFDDTVMVGATNAVRAWNWTTGRTKASLANSMNWVSSAVFMFEGTRISYETGDPVFLCVGLFMPISAYFINKSNIKNEKLEAEAAKGGMRNLEVEEFKRKCKWSGTVLLTFGGVSGSITSTYDADPRATVICSVNVVMGFSRYVMRTEHMPPRKNAFARGWEKLKEYARDMQQPVLNPVPVSGFMNHELRE